MGAPELPRDDYCNDCVYNLMLQSVLEWGDLQGPHTLEEGRGRTSRPGGLSWSLYSEA